MPPHRQITKPAHKAPRARPVPMGLQVQAAQDNVAPAVPVTLAPVDPVDPVDPVAVVAPARSSRPSMPIAMA